MSVELKSASTIKTKLGIEPNGPVHQYFTKRCAEYMDKYVPLSEGGLAYNNRKIEIDRIIYNSPYAHYMYIGKVMGPNIPIKEDGIIVRWVSPKGKAKRYTGKDIDYSKSQARGHIHAGPYWDKKMWSAEKDQVIEEIQKFVDRGGY